MNREIKFRVWCKDYNEWEKDEILLTKDGIILHNYRNGLRAIRPENHIVQFYTGLKDKNGCEIYEGDILKITIQNRPDIKSKLNWLVDFSSDRASFSVKSGNCFQTFEDILMDDEVNWEIQIIGNIFKNPELLENIS